MALVALPLGIALSVQGSSTPTTSVALESWGTDVVPIFRNSCISCHGGVGEDGEITTEASLDLTTYEGTMAGSEYGTVVEPGNADESLLLEMIVSGEMPEEGDPLAEGDIEKIRAWIAAGAQNN